MSDRTHPRTQAKYKPTLRAVHGYWKDRDEERKTTVSPEEIQRVRSVDVDPVGPKAWEREISKAIKYGY